LGVATGLVRAPHSKTTQATPAYSDSRRFADITNQYEVVKTMIAAMYVLTDLAKVSVELGDFETARPLYERNVAIRERVMFQNSIERSCRFSIVMIEELAEDHQSTQALGFDRERACYIS